jgi:hypothetical protein
MMLTLGLAFFVPVVLSLIVWVGHGIYDHKVPESIVLGLVCGISVGIIAVLLAIVLHFLAMLW